MQSTTRWCLNKGPISSCALRTQPTALSRSSEARLILQAHEKKGQNVSGVVYTDGKIPLPHAPLAHARNMSRHAQNQQEKRRQLC
jgi:hypothetical protein